MYWLILKQLQRTQLLTVVTVDGHAAADEASDTGSDAGDTDSTADGLARANAISSKFHIVTNKVWLAVIVIRQPDVSRMP